METPVSAKTRKETVGEKPVLRDLARVAAEHNAIGRGEQCLPCGSHLFTVLSGWESDMIRSDDKVTTCETLADLENALRSPDCKTIFLPADAAMIDRDIEKLCKRNGVAKTIFREVSEQ